MSTVGKSASVTLEGASGKATRTQVQGALIVDFFYDTPDGLCRATARASVRGLPVTKLLRPSPSDCGSNPTRVGVSVAFAALKGASERLTLTLKDATGTPLASATSSSGELTLTGGTVPSVSDRGGDPAAWTGTWKAVAFDGEPFQGGIAYRITVLSRAREEQ